MEPEIYICLRVYAKPNGEHKITHIHKHIHMTHDTHDTQTNKKKESKWDTNLEITTELLLQNINIANIFCFTFIFFVVAFFHLFIYLIIFVCAISISDDKKKIQIKSQKKNKIDR